MSQRLSRLLFAFTTLGCLIISRAAFAEGEGVLERSRPDYDAKGMPLGVFRLYPRLEVDVSLDDNTYRVPSSQKSDYFSQVSPSFTLQSQWSQHLLRIYAGGNLISHGQYSHEDETDWNIGVDGRGDIMRGSTVSGTITDGVLHEPRYSADSPGNLAKPNTFALFHASSEVELKPNRWGVIVGGNTNTYNFGFTPLVGGGTLDNNDRDRTQSEAFGKASYDFSPGYSAFLQASYNIRDFLLPLDRTGVDRTSQGYRIDGGIALLVTRLIRGNLFTGYLRQSHKFPLPDIAGLDFGADLSWYASELMTFHLNAARIVNDTTLPGSSASDDREVSGSLDYEVLRDVIVQAGAIYTNSQFTGLDRQDNIFGVNLGLQHLMNRYMRLTATYRYSDRNSNVAGLHFKVNTLMFGLRLQA